MFVTSAVDRDEVGPGSPPEDSGVVERKTEEYRVNSIFERDVLASRMSVVATCREALRLEGHIGWLVDLALGPDGRTVLTSGEDVQAYLWSLRPRPRSWDNVRSRRCGPRWPQTQHKRTAPYGRWVKRKAPRPSSVAKSC